MEWAHRGALITLTCIVLDRQIQLGRLAHPKPRRRCSQLTKLRAEHYRNGRWNVNKPIQRRLPPSSGCLP